MADWSDGLLLPWQPHAKMRPRISRGGARTHQDPRDRAAEDRTRNFVHGKIEELGLPVLLGNIELEVVFYRATRQVVDLDNLLKHLLDCLNGLAFKDDSQVTRYAEVRVELDRVYPRTKFLLREQSSTMKRGTDVPK